MSNRLKFSPAAVKAATAGEKTRYIYDTEERGLTLVVTPKGTKTFYYTGRVHGRTQRIPAGRFPETTVDQARANVLRIRAAVIDGRDPREAVAAARGRARGITLADFWDIYLKGYGRQHRKRWRDDEAALDLHAADLLRQPLDQITPAAVADLHRRVGRTAGEAQANKLANLLRAVYSKAILWRDADGRVYARENPAAAELVARFEERQRDRYLRSDEAPGFFKALAETQPAAARHFFQLALFTAARKNNLRTMHTRDIDLDAAVWTIPADQFKRTGRGPRSPHPIPLVPRAVHLLKLRRELQGEGWVFPGRRHNGKPIANVDFWWSSLRERGGVPDMRIHDLRRTTASYMAMTGASIPTIAQLLGHKLPGVTPTYARLALDSVRDALSAALAHLLEVGHVD